MLSNKVIVTGGGGFIGSNLANSLAEKGYDVVVIDIATDDMSKRLNPGVRRVRHHPQAGGLDGSDRLKGDRAYCRDY